MNAISAADQGSLFVPGRVNFLGEHIDYNGGTVLPFTINLGLTARWQAHHNSRVTVYSTGQTEGWTCDLESLSSLQDVPSWYRPFAAMLSVMKETPELIKAKGFTVTINSTLPPASGLSSSAAVEVLAGRLLMRVNGLASDPGQIALRAQEAEHRHIGVRCGIMDMWAIAHGRKNYLTAIDCSGPTHQYIPFNSGPWQVLVIDSGLPRTLAGSAYNDRRAACERALATLKKEWPHLNHLAEADYDMLEVIPDSVDRRRARHVVTEMDRVRRAIHLLKNQDFEATGDLLNASHASLRDDYEVTGEGLDFLASEAQRQAGCVGCRMTGAGFGGCLLALVHHEHVQAFVRHFEKLREGRPGKRLQVLAVSTDEIR